MTVYKPTDQTKFPAEAIKAELKRIENGTKSKGSSKSKSKGSSLEKLLGPNYFYLTFGMINKLVFGKTYHGVTSEYWQNALVFNDSGKMDKFKFVLSKTGEFGVEIASSEGNYYTVFPHLDKSGRLCVGSDSYPIVICATKTAREPRKIPFISTRKTRVSEPTRRNFFGWF